MAADNLTNGYSVINRCVIALAAFMTLAVAGCFLLPPGDEPGTDASMVDSVSAACVNHGDQCEGGYCLDVTGTLACYMGCTTIGDRCMSGVCYHADMQSGFSCMPEGARKPGEYCKLPNDCAPGVQCLEYYSPGSGPVMQCFLVCLSTDDCINGECTDTELGFNVCLEPGA